MEIIEYRGTYKDYTFCIVKRGIGFKVYRCGYVLVPAWHWGYEKDYDELFVKCHGGLTYTSHSLMKIDYPGWWIGFDCAHLGDSEEKQNLEYCINECKNIIDQLDSNLPHFNYEEIREYVWGDIAYRYSEEEANEIFEWPKSAILMYFKEHYEGNYKIDMEIPHE